MTAEDDYTGSLRLGDFSDLEVFHVMEDNADDAGWVLAQDISSTLEVAKRSVATRLGWLRRFGTVERDPEHRQRWRLTELGKAVLRGDPPDALARTLETYDEARLVALVRVLRERQIGREAAWLVRREWRYHDSRRRK